MQIVDTLVGRRVVPSFPTIVHLDTRFLRMHENDK